MSDTVINFEGAREFIRQKLSAELSPNLSYHSLVHILDVYNIAEKLAEMEGVKGEELTLLLTAVLFHDSGFLVGPEEHEKVSCQIAREFLPGFGYSAGQIERIEGMIMATRMPQSPHNLLEEIICDADLDYLGRDDFWTIGHKLFTELNSNGTFLNENNWNRQQVLFLENHHYFTQSAIRLRKTTKDQHLEQVRMKLRLE
jgi:uncharacterized protein